MAMIERSVADGVCVLRLAAPAASAITLELLDALRTAVGAAAADPAVGALVITGGADHFSAGADLGLFRSLRTPADAVRISRAFQEAFQEVEDCPKPVAAAVAGKVMGSALELALACHGRVAAEGSLFSMPEVTLGINPGAGGTQRLPRLIGPEAALKMLLTGQAVDAQAALDLGLVDAVCPPEALLARAGELIRSGLKRRRTSRIILKVRRVAANRQALRRAEEMVAAGRPEIVAPRKILEAVRAGLQGSVRAGLGKEREGFAACMETRATRNKLYLFFATRDAAKAVPSAADEAPAAEGAGPAEVGRAAVVGMGSMGAGIAQALIEHGLPTVVLDADAGAVERGLGRVRDSVGRRVAAGRLSPSAAEAALALLVPASGWAALADADLVIEAVFEDPQVKRAVLRQVERVVRPDALLATNTSTLSLDVLAEGMAHPWRLIGMHFFYPAHRVPLVEVVRRDATPAGVLAAGLAVARRLRKTPVLVRNREGFLVNRLFVPYLKEAFWLLEEGAPPAAIDGAMVHWGFPMGPLAVADMTGLDVLVATDRVLSGAFPRHGPLSAVASRLVEGGHRGQKTLSGVYRYERGDRTPRASDVSAAVLAGVRRESARTPREVPDEEIADRLVLRMVGEALRVLAEGIARAESDLDVAMVLGTGFPDFRGGVARYARDLGLDAVRARLKNLERRFGERFAPGEHGHGVEGAS
jgi:3-hydroxyacyl-CoA dehydrogenase